MPTRPPLLSVDRPSSMVPSGGSDEVRPVPIERVTPRAAIRSGARAVLDRLGIEVRRAPRQRARRAGTPPHVLLACFPKSGSSYLSTLVEHLPGVARVQLVPDFDGREQELERGLVAAADHLGYVAQHHVRHSVPTQRIIDEFALTPVVLVRDLADVCVSVVDHLRNESAVGPLLYAIEPMRSWSSERLLELVVDLAAPWYLSFYVSWVTAGTGLLVTYDDVVTVPDSVLGQVVERAGIPAGPADIERAIAAAEHVPTRRNVGRSGRGRDLLTVEMRDRLSRLASYYDGVDFGPIGL